MASTTASSWQTARQVQDLQPSSVEASYEEQLLALLQRYNPRKVANVPKLLTEWAGREELLLSNIRTAYGVSRDAAAIDATPRTPPNRMAVSSGVPLRSPPSTGTIVGSRTKPAAAPTPGMALPVVDKEKRIDQIKELAIKEAAQIAEYQAQVKQRQAVQVNLGHTTKKLEQARTAVVEGRRQVTDVRLQMEENMDREREQRIEHNCQMAVHRFGKRELTRGWLTWQHLHLEHERVHRMLRSAGARLLKPKVVHALQHWKENWNETQYARAASLRLAPNTSFSPISSSPALMHYTQLSPCPPYALRLQVPG